MLQIWFSWLCCTRSKLLLRETRLSPVWSDQRQNLMRTNLMWSQKWEVSVTVQISDLYSVIHEETGCFLSICFQPSCQTRPYYGFEVLFSNPIVIPKQELHRVEASISGAYSYSGQKGRARVFYSDVTFIFDNSFGSSNGTTVGRGQFPEFLFTVKWLMLILYLKYNVLQGVVGD